jgi:hypothetical protein
MQLMSAAPRKRAPKGLPFVRVLVPYRLAVTYLLGIGFEVIDDGRLATIIETDNQAFRLLAIASTHRHARSEVRREK